MSRTSDRTSHRTSIIQECLSLGDTYDRTGEFDLALVSFRRALALDPHNLAIRHRVARGMSRRGSFENAIVLLERIVQLDPTGTAYQTDLALNLLRVGRRREALAVAQGAVDVTPAKDAARSTALLTLAQVLEAHGDETQARALYLQVIELDPSAVLALSRLGVLSARDEDLDAAEGYFLRALASDPKLVEARLGLADIQSDRDLTSEALANYLNVLDFDLEPSKTLRHLVAFLGGRRLLEYPEALAQALVSALDCDQIDDQDLARPIAYFLRDQLKRNRAAADDDVLPDFMTLMNYPLWNLFLRRCVNPDVQIERWIQHARRWLLLEVDPQEVDESQLALATAIGTQSLRNGYVYALSDEESDYLDLLSQDIDECLTSEASASPQLLEMLCLESMYRSPVPARRIVPLQGIVSRISNRGLRQLLESSLRMAETAQQPVEYVGRAKTDEPASFTFWDQFPKGPEEPLPRILRSYVRDTNRIGSNALDTLVVTSGNARSALVSARRYRGSHVTSIDSNPAAVRHAESVATREGMSNLRFLCGDAIYLRHLKQTFQVVECPRTFHHDPDPSRALEGIVSCLEPGGFIKIALPSRRAQRIFPSARQKAVRLGMAANEDSVRAFRQRLLQGLEPSLIELQLYDDFYTMSDCNELLFPQCANLFSPADIRDFTEAQDLEFLGFEFPDRKLKRLFHEHYPNSSVLELGAWERFEEMVPSAFKGGIVFWCQLAR